ncbi:MAG: acetyl-CoA carboxylase biotin carboxyl carrier protein [Micromonosporaceae bacterium]
MELTHDDVREILELLEGSSVDYLEVQLGNLHLVADRYGAAYPASAPGTPASAGPAAHTGPASTPATAPAPPAPTPAEASAESAEPSTPTAPAASEPSDEEEGLVAVAAPVLGVFYAASEPGAPPYVEVGSEVDAGATVGLIEVMKMFNSVTAEVSGQVARVLVDNAEFVEHGQPLFLVRPR